MQRKAENLHQLFGEMLQRLAEGKTKGQTNNKADDKAVQYQHVS